jgi:hypothetical protein
MSLTIVIRVWGKEWIVQKTYKLPLNAQMLALLVVTEYHTTDACCDLGLKTGK